MHNAYKVQLAGISTQLGQAGVRWQVGPGMHQVASTHATIATRPLSSSTYLLTYDTYLPKYPPTHIFSSLAIS